MRLISTCFMAVTFALPVSAQELLSCRVDHHSTGSDSKSFIVEGESLPRGQEGVKRLWLKLPNEPKIFGAAEVFRGYANKETPRTQENEFLVLAVRLFDGIDPKTHSDLFDKSFLNSKDLVSQMYRSAFYIDQSQLIDNRSFSDGRSEGIDLSAKISGQQFRVKCHICVKRDC